ncbi:hypothetical protein FACS1894107_03700 [Planctomycetales bacterium]|nr:hypothetical protein FACS1894107_03700 [Planctomycetales bacterium]
MRKTFTAEFKARVGFVRLDRYLLLRQKEKAKEAKIKKMRRMRVKTTIVFLSVFAVP